jgi:hypothetical protein
VKREKRWGVRVKKKGSGRVEGVRVRVGIRKGREK